MRHFRLVALPSFLTALVLMTAGCASGPTREQQEQAAHDRAAAAAERAHQSAKP